MEENWILRNRKYKALAERLTWTPCWPRLSQTEWSRRRRRTSGTRMRPGESILMADMEVAVTLILAHIEVHSKIKIIGDYDGDG
ncbi:MAG: hypothetical protein ACLR23_08570 [Clostridia bacterium]